MSGEPKTLEPYISHLRIAATAAVVLIHTAAAFVGHDDIYSFSPQEGLWMREAIALMKWAVPVFFMLTGALLLRPGRRLTYGVCLKRYALKIGLCLLLFGFAMGALRLWATGGLPISPATGADGYVGTAFHGFTSGRPSTLQDLAALLQAIGSDALLCLKSVIDGTCFVHLWYLYALLGLYMVMPMLKAFVEADEARGGSGLRAALVLLLIFSLLMPMAEELTGVHIALTMPLPCSVFYLLLGHLMARGTPLSPWLSLAALLGGAAGLYLMVRAGAADSLMGYDNPLAALMAAALFSLFRRYARRPSGGRALQRLWTADRLCLGVYLVHPLLIIPTYRLGLTPSALGLPIAPAIILLWLAFTLGSFLASWLMTRLPLLRRLLT